MEPRIVIFENQLLPKYAIHMDVLWREFCTGLSEECREWYWKFAICVGVPRTEASSVVIEYADDAMDFIQSNKQALLDDFKKHLSEYPAVDIFDSFIESLKVMKAFAEMDKECTWVSPALPGDLGYLEAE